MSIVKQIKDQIIKILWDGKSVPQELFELLNYFRNNGPIEFEFKKEGGEIVAISNNYRHGTIVTSGKSQEELDNNIQDAILTAFEVPSSYKKEAAIHNVSRINHAHAYA